MSSHAQVLVLRVEQPSIVAAKVLEQIVKAKIVEPMPTGCVMGDLGHPPGPRIDTAIDNPEDVRHVPNGLAIEFPGKIELYFPPDGGKPWVTCAPCLRPLEEDVLLAHLGPRNPFRKSKLARCPGCGDERPIEDWVAHDSAFGNLAFFFWSWHLRADFIGRVQDWASSTLVLIDYTL